MDKTGLLFPCYNNLFLSVNVTLKQLSKTFNAACITTVGERKSLGEERDEYGGCLLLGIIHFIPQQKGSMLTSSDIYIFSVI